MNKNKTGEENMASASRYWDDHDKETCQSDPEAEPLYENEAGIPPQWRSPGWKARLDERLQLREK